MIHRDLKPENILVDELGNVVLTDFELAVKYAEGPPSKEDVEVVGTPMYIPPEIGQKQLVDIERYDIWSLGVVAWEILCDSNPWGINIWSCSPTDTLSRTNSTTTMPAKGKPTGMSDVYFDFLKRTICQHSERLSVQEAMDHELFKGKANFSDPQSLFHKVRPHPDLRTLASLAEVMKVDATASEDCGVSEAHTARSDIQNSNKADNQTAYRSANMMSSEDDDDDDRKTCWPDSTASKNESELQRRTIQNEIAKFKEWQMQQQLMPRDKTARIRLQQVRLDFLLLPPLMIMICFFHVPISPIFHDAHFPMNRTCFCSNAKWIVPRSNNVIFSVKHWEI